MAIEFHKYPKSPPPDIYPGGSLHPLRTRIDSLGLQIEVPEFSSSETTPSRFESGIISYDVVTDTYEIKFLDAEADSKPAATELVYSRDGELQSLVVNLPTFFHHFPDNPDIPKNLSIPNLHQKLLKSRRFLKVAISLSDHQAQCLLFSNSRLEFKDPLKWEGDYLEDVITTGYGKLLILMETNENRNSLNLYVGNERFGRQVPFSTLSDQFANFNPLDHISAYELLDSISLSKHGSLPERNRK